MQSAGSRKLSTLIRHVVSGASGHVQSSRMLQQKPRQGIAMQPPSLLLDASERLEALLPEADGTVSRFLCKEVCMRY